MFPQFILLVPSFPRMKSGNRLQIPCNILYYEFYEILGWPCVLIPLSNTDITRAVWGHSPECLAVFLGIFGNIPLNIWEHSPECLARYLECLVTFLEMFDDIPRNVWGYSPECLATFPGMLGNIPWNVWQHSTECLRTFPGMFSTVP